MNKSKSKSADSITVTPLQVATIQVPIIGQTELITHKWSEKAMKMMLDKQMGIPVEKRPKKNPQEDYESSIYRDEEGNIVMPSAAFKAAIVGGCRLFDNITMTSIKQAVRVDGAWTRIYGKPEMRTDMVRLESGVADIRHRAGFKKWKAVLGITFVMSVITQEQLIHLVNAAGLGGVGEWRATAPNSCTGSFGSFRLATEQEYKEYKV